MKKILSTILALVVLAGGALALTAFRGHGDPARMDRFITHRLDDMLDDVHATDAQRQQITAIKDKLVAEGKALHAGHRDEEVRRRRRGRPAPGARHPHPRSARAGREEDAAAHG